jgi:hypothetical protein
VLLDHAPVLGGARIKIDLGGKKRQGEKIHFTPHRPLEKKQTKKKKKKARNGRWMSYERVDQPANLPESWSDGLHNLRILERDDFVIGGFFEQPRGKIQKTLTLVLMGTG